MYNLNEMLQHELMGFIIPFLVILFCYLYLTDFMNYVVYESIDGEDVNFYC